MSISKPSPSHFNMRFMSSSTSPRGIAAIVGVGPKLGRSVACKFAQEGFTVAILSRDLEKLSRLADEVARVAKAQVFAIRIDCADSRSVREAFEGVLSLGVVEVLIYNACHEIPDQPTRTVDMSLESFEKALAVSAVGAFHCAQQVIPGMCERGRGTILFTGASASLTGFAGYSALSCGKFALRGLSQSLGNELRPLGIHVAHVVLDGPIGQPGSSSSRSDATSSVLQLDPDVLAQTYWYLHIQDKGAWTHEIDLRAASR